VSETPADPRFFLARMGTAFNVYVCPLFRFMFNLDAPMEDLHWMGNVFGSSVFEVPVNVPSYSALWHASSNAPAYRFLKLTQQAVQFQDRGRAARAGKPWTGPKRWLMKTPEHAGFLRDLMSVYPDALVVLTHRDPVPIVSSFCAMAPYIATFWNARMDAHLFGMNNMRQLESRLNHLVDQIGVVPESQVFHLPFSEFVDDNLGAMERVAAFAGLDMGADNVQRMRAFIASRPRQGANVLEYRIETLGPEFSKTAIQERFRRYADTFKQYI